MTELHVANHMKWDGDYVRKGIAEPITYEAMNSWHVLLDAAGTEAVMDLITEAGTPSGAWDAFKGRYSLQDTAAISQLRHSMQNAILEPNGNPIQLLAILETLCARLADFGEPVETQSMPLYFLDRFPLDLKKKVRQLCAQDILDVENVERVIRTRFDVGEARTVRRLSPVVIQAFTQ